MKGLIFFIDLVLMNYNCREFKTNDGAIEESYYRWLRGLVLFYRRRSSLTYKDIHSFGTDCIAILITSPWSDHFWNKKGQRTKVVNSDF